VFDDVDVITALVEDGREVGALSYKAKVVAFSTNYDCAVLLVRSSAVKSPKVKFPPAGYIPAPGDAITHVGSPLGVELTGSVLTGTISAIGRVIERQPFDQSSVLAYPGCSGGGVFNVRGEWIGMVARAAGPGLNLVIPIRVVREWADTEDLGFLFK
jgi:serine protease Do